MLKVYQKYTRLKVGQKQDRSRTEFQQKVNRRSTDFHFRKQTKSKQKKNRNSTEIQQKFNRQRAEKQAKKEGVMSVNEALNIYDKASKKHFTIDYLKRYEIKR